MEKIEADDFTGLEHDVILAKNSNKTLSIYTYYSTHVQTFVMVYKVEMDGKLVVKDPNLKDATKIYNDL